MEIAALVSFGALLVAWIMAPSNGTATGRIEPAIRAGDIRSITSADVLPEIPSAS